jgi:hypothetical protein
MGASFNLKNLGLTSGVHEISVVAKVDGMQNSDICEPVNYDTNHVIGKWKCNNKSLNHSAYLSSGVVYDLEFRVNSRRFTGICWTKTSGAAYANHNWLEYHDGTDYPVEVGYDSSATGVKIKDTYATIEILKDPTNQSIKNWVRAHFTRV